MPSSFPPVKSSSSFKKWFPAILFAIAFHAVIFAIFLNSQKTTTHDNNSANEIIMEKDANGENKSNQTEVRGASDGNTSLSPEDLKNLSENKGIEVGLVNDEALDRNKLDKNSQLASSKTALSNKSTNPETRKIDQSSKGNGLIDNSIEAVVANEPNAPNGSFQSKTNEQQKELDRPSLQIDESSAGSNLSNTQNYSTAQGVQGRTQGNRVLLLPMDISGEEAKALTLKKDGELSVAAQKTQEINEKLSNTIREIKDEKMKRIEDKLKMNSQYQQNTNNQVGNKNGEVKQLDKTEQITPASNLNNSNLNNSNLTKNE